MIVTSGLVGYWHYSQVNGAVWENIAPGREGQFNGDIVGGVVQDDGMYFDGSSYVSVPALGLTGDTTIEARFTFDSSLTTTMNPHIVGGNGNHILRLNRTTNSMQYVIGTSIRASKPLVTEPNTWYHVVAAYNYTLNRVDFYINGSHAGFYEDPAAVKQIWDQIFHIGKRQNSADSSLYHKGKIAALRFYNKPLSEQEVLQNYQMGGSVGLSSDGIIAKWFTSGVLQIKGELIEGSQNVSFKQNGDLHVQELSEGSTSVKSNLFEVTEFIEGAL
ncbi:LamG domain-containing protein [Cytobacillus sp. Bac17]|uniref:LamG domain-containing protein n=1 Tax=Cytobacillus sp. Bac17 TaxID=2926008 RepID=UPI0021181C67|nr:LamG domain-containing protein [Cytobacillus sp. Bac17]